MTTARLSALEPLRWLDWLIRLRWLALVGVFLSACSAAVLLGVDLPVRRTTMVAVLFASVLAPYLVLALALFKTVSMACVLAGVLRDREHRLQTARRARSPRPAGLAAPQDPAGARSGGDASGAASGEASGAEDATGPLQVVRSNLELLTATFDDILPILDQRHASGPPLQVARLDYPFFRERVPSLLHELAAGVTRLGAVLPPGHGPRPSS